MHREKPFIASYPRLPVYILAGLGLLLRLPGFNRSLWFDEVLYSTHSIFLWNTTRLLWYIRYDNTAPFHHLLMFLWIRIFGDSELSVRLPSLVCGALSIVLVYWLALKLTNRKTAFLTSFLLCLSPVHIWYSQEATPYAMAMFLFLLTVFSFYKLQEDKVRPHWFFIYFISCLAASFTNWSLPAYLLLLSVLCSFSRSRYKKGILILNGIIGVSLVLFLIWKFQCGSLLREMDFLRPFSLFELWALFFNWFSFGNAIWSIPPYKMNLSALLQTPWILLSQIIVGIIFFKGLISIIREHKTNGIHTVLFLLFWPLVLWLPKFLGHRNFYTERYAFVILPFFYMILSQGITGTKNKVMRGVLMAVVIIFALVTVREYFFKKDQWTVYKQNPNWRSATQYLLEEQKNSGKPIVIFICFPSDELYYYRDKFSHGGHAPSPFLLTHALEVVFYDKIILPTNPSEFYFINNKWWAGNSKKLLGIIRTSLKAPLLSTRTFEGLEIYKFRIP